LLLPRVVEVKLDASSGRFLEELLGIVVEAVVSQAQRRDLSVLEHGRDRLGALLADEVSVEAVYSLWTPR